MGYEIQFDLVIESYPDKSVEIPEETLESLSDVLAERTPLLPNSVYSWYTDWERWGQPEEEVIMGEISEQFPTLLFTLRGHGEDDDYWAEYFQNGQMQESNVRLVWDDFDETKTKSYKIFEEECEQHNAEMIAFENECLKKYKFSSDKS